MQLPPSLRRVIKEALAGIPLADLSRAAEHLSQRYRAEVRDGRPHIGDATSASAYLATRLPATYAACRASLEALVRSRPDLAPRSVLDVGAGPGTAVWAAAAVWPGLTEAVLVEANAEIRAWGEVLAALATLRVIWRSDDIRGGLPDLAPADLVTLAYVLDEIPQAARSRLVDRLWALTGDTLLIVEPGTPAGWRRILSARTRLIAAGAHLVAPCPHAAACPLAPPDWCHFASRLARSRMHRKAKSATVPWEDEKFIFLAASRLPGRTPAARVIGPPRSGHGRVSLKLCRRDGTAAETLVTRRRGAPFRTARRLGWGDAVEEP